MEERPGHTHFINPFRIEIDPMDRLLLVNFEKDPDVTYIGFEPQVFIDNIHGNGHIVIGWRVDGKVDVYHEPGLRLNTSSYDIAGKGLANMVATPMEKAIYEIGEQGVKAHYKFTDKDQREIEIQIEEKNSGKRKPFGLLAPMGDAAENPSSLPLVWLHDFYFVQKDQILFRISINNRLHKPDSLSLPMDFSSMYFTRYSPKPLIATLNPAFEGVMEALKINPRENKINDRNHLLELTWKNDTPHLNSLTRVNIIYPVKLVFTPAFPNLYDLNDEAEIKGNFSIQSDPSTGSITGEYKVSKGKNSFLITMNPSGGWKPQVSKFSLWFLYKVARIFRQWPKTYIWEAHLEQENGHWRMRSKWIRNGRILKKAS